MSGKIKVGDVVKHKYGSVLQIVEDHGDGWFTGAVAKRGIIGGYFAYEDSEQYKIRQSNIVDVLEDSDAIIAG
jgi:hypothetical protein